MTNDAVDRQALRSRMRQLRQAISGRQRAQAAQRLATQLLQLPQYCQANVIAFYYPTTTELDTRPALLHALAAGKTCLLPTIVDPKQRRMVFMPYTTHTILETDCHGINAPRYDSQHVVTVQAIDCMLLPLLAIDPAGYRLGMGLGYYDRYLAPLTDRNQRQQPTRPHLIGIGYSQQRVPSTAPNPWDIPCHTTLCVDTNINP